jgi:peptide subunit release factor 1 (eRF1)
MISREELWQLANFECQAGDELAISFYFQPGAPRDKSHREESILAKDLVRNSLRELGLNGRSREAMKDLENLLRMAEALRGNSARAKAVFACASRRLWKEYELPPTSMPTRLLLNRRFHLKPLATVFSEYPLVWIACIDRQSARFYELQFDEIRNVGLLSNPQPRHGRSDGYAGYDGGHAQRHVDDEARRHFRQAAEILKNAAEKKQFEALVIACQDVNWPDLQGQLHPYVQKRLLGRFVPAAGVMSEERIRLETERVKREALVRHREGLIRETLDEARANGRGATGLRRVLRALELGEVDKLIMTHDYMARAVECTSCKHLDSHIVPYCPLCGRATRELEDVCESLVPAAMRNHIGLILTPAMDSLDQVGNIAAMLRFRADRSTNQLRAAS